MTWGTLILHFRLELTAIASALSNNPSEADVQAQADAVTALAGTTDAGIKAVQASIDAETAKLSGQ